MENTINEVIETVNEAEINDSVNDVVENVAETALEEKGSSRWPMIVGVGCLVATGGVLLWKYVVKPKVVDPIREKRRAKLEAKVVKLIDNDEANDEAEDTEATTEE